MHCNKFFPNSILILKILGIYSGKQRPPTTHCPSPDASRSPPPAAGSASPTTSLKCRRVMRCRNTVRAAEPGSPCLTHHSFGDCKLPAQPVSPWPLHHVATGSTLLRGERGVQCQRFTPSHLAGRQSDRGNFCLWQTKMHHAVPETMALSQLNYGRTILQLNTSCAFVYISIRTRTSKRKDL